MRARRILTQLTIAGATFVMAATMALSTASADAGPDTGQGAVSAQLAPVAGSGVSGAATLSTAEDATMVTLDVTGLRPGAQARSTLQSGTCAMPSASFADLPALVADASGRAMVTGQVMFRDTDIPLWMIADGDHIITINLGGQVVACGAIPSLGVPGAPTEPGPPAYFSYTVERGDTLWALARRYGSTVKALVDANPAITNPELIYIGQRIRIALPGGVT